MLWHRLGHSWMLIVAWVFHAFVPLVLCLLGVKTVWALSFRCFVSSLMAWAKFLCLRVLLFSLSVELLQILIFWLPYLGFVLPHLSETTFTTLWDSLPAPAVPRFPRCSRACFIHPIAAFWLQLFPGFQGSSSKSKLLLCLAIGSWRQFVTSTPV